MDIRTEIIVLNKFKYNDTAYIANVFSQENGKLAVYLRIPKTKKAAVKPGLFFPLNIIETEINQKSRRNIQNLKHCTALVPLHNICTDVYRSSIAQFIAELIGKTIKEGEPDTELFIFIKGFINYLEYVENASSNLHLLFIAKYAKYLGFGITNNYSEHTQFFNLKEGMFLPVYTTDDESMTKELSELLSELLELSFENIHEIKIAYKNRKEILKKLLFYFRIHLEDYQEIKSVSVLNSVFTD